MFNKRPHIAVRAVSEWMPGNTIPYGKIVQLDARTRKDHTASYKEKRAIERLRAKKEMIEEWLSESKDAFVAWDHPGRQRHRDGR